MEQRLVDTFTLTKGALRRGVMESIAKAIASVDDDEVVVVTVYAWSDAPRKEDPSENGRRGTEN